MSTLCDIEIMISIESLPVEARQGKWIAGRPVNTDDRRTSQALLPPTSLRSSIRSELR